MKDYLAVLIFIFAFTLGMGLCAFGFDSLAKFKAKMYCKQAIEYECDCVVQGKYMTYYATYTTRSGRKAEKYFDWFSW